MSYIVSDTREIKRMTPAGTEQVFYRVWLRTDLGATGTVDVPTRQWNKDDLPDILADKAARLDLAFDVSA